MQYIFSSNVNFSGLLLMLTTLSLRIYFLMFFSFISTYAIAETNTLKVHNLTHQPHMDAEDDWNEIPYSSFTLKSISKGIKKTKVINIKAATYKNKVYFFANWPDEKQNSEHKPFIWNKSTSRYVRGPQREDRFALQFEMEGDYTSNWLEAKYFKADMWHWKSSRTAPANLIHDKYTIISDTKLTRSREIKTSKNKSIYIQRISDKGNSIYTSLRYGIYKGDKLPKYVINKHLSGSIIDVNAYSKWIKGKWYLEINRKLNTNHNDDVAFIKDKKVKFGIAVFNASPKEEHFISETLSIVF